MFDIEVIGNKSKKEYIEMLCLDILAYLMPRTTRNIDITIRFVKQCETQEAGYCTGDKQEANIVVAKNSNNYKIPFDEQLLTLCHELVHAKQFLKGELTNGMYWKGEDYSKVKSIKNQPWEQEATTMENILFEKYIKQL